MKLALSAGHCWDIAWHSHIILCRSSVFIPAACTWPQTFDPAPGAWPAALPCDIAKMLLIPASTKGTVNVM